MSTPLFSNLSRTALINLGVSFMMATANAQPQPQSPFPMPADIVKPIPKMDMKGGMEMKPGMKQGADMQPMMMDMHEKMMAMKPTDNTDVDFAMMMRLHHQAAITMSEAQLQNGTDPQMRVMAKDIIRAQKNEIAVFDKFLAKRGEPGMKTPK